MVRDGGRESERWRRRWRRGESERWRRRLWRKPAQAAAATQRDLKAGISRGGTQVPLFIKKFEIYITARITAPITAIIPAYIPAVITGHGDGH